jgi:uncharacterized integral membrane protein
MEKKNKKKISVKAATRGLITGFVAYSILVMFIFIALVILITWIINNNKTNINYDVIKYSLPAIGAFLIFFLVKAICRLSTFDLFRKCKIEEKDIEIVSGRTNFFYLFCIAFSVLVILIYLLARFNNEQLTIQQFSNDYYDTYSEEYADYLTEKMANNFAQEKANVLIGTLIVESGLLLGILSLISTQRNLIEKYN